MSTWPIAAHSPHDRRVREKQRTAKKRTAGELAADLPAPVAGEISNMLLRSFGNVHRFWRILGVRCSLVAIDSQEHIIHILLIFRRRNEQPPL